MIDRVESEHLLNREWYSECHGRFDRSVPDCREKERRVEVEREPAAFVDLELAKGGERVGRGEVPVVSVRGLSDEAGLKSCERGEEES